MPLITDVQARISTQRLTELTNHEDPGAASPDLTLLQDVVDDVEADFQTYAGVTFDDTDSRHVSMGIMGVIYKLQVYNGQSASEDNLFKWRLDLTDRLRLVTGNNRIRPKSSSKLTPQDPNPANNATTRPLLDPNGNLADDIIPHGWGG